MEPGDYFWLFVSVDVTVDDFIVSRPFVIKEIASGNLPHRMVGTHRRILFEDLARYAARMQAKRNEALDKMAANARELGLDY